MKEPWKTLESCGENVLRIFFKDGQVYDLEDIYCYEDSWEAHAFANVVNAVEIQSDPFEYSRGGRKRKPLCIDFMLDDIDKILDINSRKVLYSASSIVTDE